jgi:hypothetical protein
MTEPLTLTCGQVAEVLNYFDRANRPDRRVIRKLAKDGAIPPPIDPELALCYWRWSRTEIESYVAGTWKTGAS